MRVGTEGLLKSLKRSIPIVAYAEFSGQHDGMKRGQYNFDLLYRHSNELALIVRQAILNELPKFLILFVLHDSDYILVPSDSEVSVTEQDSEE